MPENNSSSEQVKTPEAEQVNNMKSFDFAVASKDVKIEEEDGYKVATVPVQAPTEDRDGDIVTDSGQEAAIKQFKSGEVGAFPNHGWAGNGVRYDYREMMGQWIDASEEDGVTMAKLRLRKDEDRESGLHKSAEELVDLLEQDMPVGFSIGFIPTDTEERDEGGGYKIHDMDLMECSPVGIPSNPMGNPQALSAADQMAIAAKGAVAENGMDPEAIGKTITNELKDTMGDDTSEEDGKEESGEPDTALSEHDLQNLREVFKDTLKASSMDVKITSDELDEVLGIVGGAAQGAEEDLIDGIESVADLDDDVMEDVGGVIESVMGDMVDSVESELEQLVEEEDEADEDEDEEEDAADEDDDEEESSADAEENSKDGEEASADDGDGEDDGKEGEPDEEDGLDEDEKTVDDSGKGKTLSGDDDLDDEKQKDGYTPEPKTEGWGDTV